MPWMSSGEVSSESPELLRGLVAARYAPWVGALAEWRRIGCAAAGSLVEEGLRENEDLQAPWPRMLSAALLSAAPCALPAARTPHVGPFRVQAPS